MCSDGTLKTMTTTKAQVGVCNVPSRTIFEGDNLDVMRGMNDECVDLIYLDPPFNSNRNYAAPIGSKAAGAAFKDTWNLTDVDEAWHNQIADTNLPLYKVIDASQYSHSGGMKSYLIMMAVRLLEMKRILKPNGSVYLHCDPTASHHLKTLMDTVFGKENFRNEIIWSYRRWPSKGSQYQTMHDHILFYAGKGNVFNIEYEPPSESYLRRFKGKTQVLDPVSRTRKLVVDKPTKGLPMRDVWNLSILAGSSKERTGFPTQKPLKLLDRIIETSTNEGDIVLDPFCGCATTCIAAERLDRQWIGIDLSPLAVKLVEQRARNELGLMGGIQATSRTDIPKRTDREPAPPLSASKVVLYGTQAGHCNGCGTHFMQQHLTVDHIIAQSKGGTSHLDNLQLLCAHCNSLKGNRPMEYLKARLAREYAG